MLVNPVYGALTFGPSYSAKAHSPPKVRILWLVCMTAAHFPAKSRLEELDRSTEHLATQVRLRNLHKNHSKCATRLAANRHLVHSRKSKYWPIRIPGDPPLGRDPRVEKHCITYHYLALVPYFPDYKSIWSISRASIMMNKKNPNIYKSH